MICSIQFNFESIIIPRYFALYTLALEVASITKSLQLVFFILALCKATKKFSECSMKAYWILTI